MIVRVTSRWEALAACDHEVSHLISIQNPDADVGNLRPDSIPPENHLLLLFEDLNDPEDAAGPKDHQDSAMDGILTSHLIDPESMRSDDFEAFWNRRAQTLLALIEKAMGKAVEEEPEGLHSEPEEVEPEPLEA